MRCGCAGGGRQENLVLSHTAEGEQNEEMNVAELFEMLPQVFPWVRFLPPDDTMGFVSELVELMSSGVEPGSPEVVLQIITEWRNTAQIHSDPELLEVLSSRAIQGGGQVPSPVA